MPQWLPEAPQQAMAVCSGALSDFAQQFFWSVPLQQEEASTDLSLPSFMQAIPALPAQQDSASSPAFALALWWQHAFASLLSAIALQHGHPVLAPDCVPADACPGVESGLLWLAVWANENIERIRAKTTSLNFMTESPLLPMSK
jgi:hypothetical protein